MYRERPSRLPGAVVWWGTNVPVGGVQRILPDGCMDLLWHDGALLVAGPDTAAYLSTVRPGTGFVGLRLAPGTGPAVLGVPADELLDSRVPLEDLWPAARVRRLDDLLDGLDNLDGLHGLHGLEGVDGLHGLDGTADSDGPRVRVGALLERIAAAGARPDPVTARIVAGVRAGAPVASIAGEIGLSERQLHRRCLAAFGYGAKTLARILRMNRAVTAAYAGVAPAAVAAACGYADQAHLARDVKRLAGVPLGALVR